ncbi:MAG TPA: LuxR C-terminal-related transcriptional regulator [Kineosporiaceae bacterium]
MPSALETLGNLPMELTSFVGRREELSDGRRLLSQTRLLTLVGPGGVGKTRLALCLAAGVRRAFPDGVWLVELDQLADPRLLVQAVATALGLRERAADWPAELLRAHLASRHLLLVLDNCEHLLDGCRKLADRLLRESRYLRVLATSRESFGILPEVTFPVPPLPVSVAGAVAPAAERGHPDAVRLFLDRARQVSPGFRLTDDNYGVISEICRRVDGLPLAIELAAARVRVLDPQQILARLEPPYRLLKRAGGSSSDRHGTIVDSIRWSYDLCAGVEQKLWERLATFSGGFELEAAEVVGADEDLAVEDVLDVVSALVSKSIVVRQEGTRTGRLKMLEVLRAFGLERLRESGAGVVVRRRHLGHVEQLVGGMESDWVSPRQGEWLARIDLEHANLRAALDFALTDPDGAPRALTVLVTLPHYYWWTRGLLAEGRYWLGRALSQAPVGSGPSPVQVRALLLDSQLAVGQGVFDPEAFRAASELAQQLGDPRTLALASYVEGLGALWTGDLHTARSVLRRASRTAAGGVDPDIEIEALTVLTVTMATNADIGDPDELQACYAAVLDRSEPPGEIFHRTYAHWGVGIAAWCAGDLARALQLHREALRWALDLDDRNGIAWCLEPLAWIAAAHGQLDRAATLLGAAAALWNALRTGPEAFHHLQAYHVDCDRRLRDTLGDAAFDAAMRRGSHLSTAEAVQFALDDKAGRPSPPSASTSPASDDDLLTRRERQVAMLVAEGRSNKDIAASLVISQRTAEGHVERIMMKLGFTSRAQVAAWVVSRRGDQSGAG